MATDDPPPQGARFSQVYIERGEPTGDSVRMRHRIASAIPHYRPLDDGLRDAVQRRIGIAVPYMTDWQEFLKEIELRDVLDLVTVAHRVLWESRKTDVWAVEKWLHEVQTVFLEENTHYRVDKAGGVHFHFDEEFARGRAATIAALQAQRYRNVLDAFDGSLNALSKTPPDGKAAIRQTFAAAEGLFRLMFSNAPRLTAKELDRLQPLIQAATTGNPTACSVASKLLASFKDWVDAAHFYRHEAGAEEVSQPPLTLAVHMTSLGASFIRWLAELDPA
jgi:hypothetical protein